MRTVDTASGMPAMMRKSLLRPSFDLDLSDRMQQADSVMASTILPSIRMIPRIVKNPKKV